MILELDFETTGLCERECGIVEIGARWHTEDGSRVGKFFRECRPREGALVEEEALKVNGYTKERVFDAARMPEAQAIVELLAFIRGSKPCKQKVMVAAWNAPFEMRFLRSALKRAGVEERHWGLRHSALCPQAILTADMIRGHVRKTAEGFTVKSQPPSFTWGGLTVNSDLASQILGIPPEERPHNALRGAEQVHLMLEALGVKQQVWEG